MGKLVFTLLLALTCIYGKAQNTEKGNNRLEFGLNYTGELQTDLRGGSNFLSLLRLDGRVNITRNLRFDISTLSIGRAKDCMMYDLQVFSNIETGEEIPLTLAVAGMEWEADTQHGSHKVFVGIRNTGEDYFCSDVTSFFVNSSCGIFPTLSANFPMATYPFGAMSVHYAYEGEHWGAKATIYNGEGRYKLHGRENMFRVCPKSDKVIAMAQGEYRNNSAGYYLGGSLYDSSATMWAYTEQKLCNTSNGELHGIAAYSHCFDKDYICRNFAGAGLKMDMKGAQIGLFADYADFGELHEFASELSVEIPVCKFANVKPALHYINGSTTEGVVAMVRVNLKL